MYISEITGCHLLRQMILSEGHKNYFKDWWIKKMAILSKVCKPDHFEWHNSLKLGFTNIWALHSNFDGCESFLEANSPDILTLCKRNIDDSIYSDNFSVRGFLHLIWKDSITHKPSLTAYVKLISNYYKLHALLHKTHRNVLTILRYQGSTSVGPPYH